MPNAGKCVRSYYFYTVITVFTSASFLVWAPKNISTQGTVMLTRLLFLISIAASLLLRRWLPIWLFLGYIAFKIYQIATKDYFEGVDKRLQGPPGVPFLGKRLKFGIRRDRQKKSVE